MSFYVICENGLNRDERVLRLLLANRDVKVTSREGETLDDRSARLVEREFLRRGEKFVLVIHRDADAMPWKKRKAMIETWFKKHKLQRFATRLLACVPEPCTERWLCLGAGLKHQSRQTQRPCDPWKETWEKQSAPEHHRLEASVANLVKQPPPELADFLSSLVE
jgi:hypothetical protein